MEWIEACKVAWGAQGEVSALLRATGRDRSRADAVDLQAAGGTASGWIALRVRLGNPPREIPTAAPCDDSAVSTAPAIEVRDLHKRYGAYEAVRGIDITVQRGEVFGLLGPNGAGKTTTVEILEGYRARSSGEVSVLGCDPASRSIELRRRIGIVLQSGGIYSHVTPREALRHWARFYPHPREVEEVLELAGLQEKADVRSRKLSGGQLRRLDFALALVGDPELLFLDEPTTGFDPAARRTAWELVRSLRALGKTILLTTHYLDEAQALADRVAIVKDGRVLAIGPPRELGTHPPGTHLPEPTHPPRTTASPTATPRASWSSTRLTTPPACCTRSPPKRWRAASAWRSSPSGGRRWRTCTWS